MDALLKPMLMRLQQPQSILLTPNNRLANFLQTQYALLQQQTGIHVYETPLILPLTTWLRMQYDAHCRANLRYKGYLLDTHQQCILWEMIIRDNLSDDQLINVSATAELANSARALLGEWLLTHDIIDEHDPGDCQTYKNWCQQYLAYCHANQLIDNVMMAEVCLEQMSNGSIHLPTSISLYGFIEYSPLIKKLIAICQSHQCHVYDESITHEVNDTVTLTEFQTPDDEIQSIARWAKALHDEKPSATIACVIPSLGQRRNKTLKLFSNVFDIPHSTDEKPYNISAGTALADLPMIESAFFLLGLYRSQLRAKDLTTLLTMNTLAGSAKESNSRALYDAKLRRFNLDTINLLDLLADNSASQLPLLSRDCKILTRHLRDFYSLYTTYSTQASYQTWADCFSNLLLALGWPGDASVTSQEYQQVQAWQSLLLDFGKLDYISTTVNFQTALAQLKKQAKRTLFHEKTPAANIQILGTLEATGIPFDYLWLAGMDDANWPASPNPHPFIPKALQVQEDMPHATSDRELAYCSMLLAHFQKLTQHMQVSYSKTNDKLELSPSPLVKPFPLVDHTQILQAALLDPIEQLIQSQQVEYFRDSQGPLLTITSQAIRGGANILKEQARCPFKAFAEYRLHAKPMESITQGLLAHQRGSILHHVLEILWQRIPSKQRLLELTLSDQESLIRQCIEDAFAQNSYLRIKNATLSELEKERLVKLLMHWLAVEAKRPNFRVMALEKEASIVIEPLTLNVRVDRIDQLDDGTTMIIDYKTGGHHEIGHWFSQRPDDPQLPMYALQGDDAKAISFAIIHHNEWQFKGIAADDTISINGIKSIMKTKQADGNDWHAQKQSWQSTLESLAKDYANGQARVDPKYGRTTCQWCQLGSLCRVAEQGESTDE